MIKQVRITKAKWGSIEEINEVYAVLDTDHKDWELDNIVQEIWEEMLSEQSVSIVFLYDIVAKMDKDPKIKVLNTVRPIDIIVENTNFWDKED